MRAVLARSSVSVGPSNAHRLWWLQAGSSFAYRLAHLSVLRSVLVFAVALVLYLS